MDIEKRVEQALEDIEMMSEEEAIMWVAQMDEEILQAIVETFLGSVRRSSAQ